MISHKISGAIWTSMVRTYESNGKIECEVVYGQDSNSNELNIFWLVPQYVIITMSEVRSTKPILKPHQLSSQRFGPNPDPTPSQTQF